MSLLQVFPWRATVKPVAKMAAVSVLSISIAFSRLLSIPLLVLVVCRCCGCCCDDFEDPEESSYDQLMVVVNLV